MSKLATNSRAPVARRRSRPVKSKVHRERAVVTLTYNAVIERHGDWWIGWIKDVPGVNCQEKTRAALLRTLRITLGEVLVIRQATADDLPIPDEHLRIIEERLRESPTSPADSLSWDDVKAGFRRAARARRR